MSGSPLRTATASRAAERRRLLTRLALERAADAADDDARSAALDDVVVLHLDVAGSVARRYRGRGIELDDLVQVARVALVGASRRFDPARGDDFLAFAVPTMHGEIKRHFRDHGWVVKPPRALQELHERAGRRRSDLAQELGREPALTELAADLGEDADDVARALDLDGAFRPASLDRALFDDGDAVASLVVDLDGERALGLVEARALLLPLLQTLDERELTLLSLRYVQERSQAEIGLELGVTQSQVSRLLQAVLLRLRSALGHPERLPA